MTRIDVHTGDKTFLLKPPDDLGKLFHGCVINTIATFADRRIFEKHGLFSTDYKFANDHEFLVRVFFSRRRVRIQSPKILPSWREGGMSHKHYIRACRESFNLTVKHGYPVAKALFVFLITVLKKGVERRIAKWCPSLLKPYRSIKFLSLKSNTWHGNRQEDFEKNSTFC